MQQQLPETGPPVTLDDLESDSLHVYHLAETIVDRFVEANFSGDPNGLHSPKNVIGSLIWILRDQLERQVRDLETFRRQHTIQRRT